MQPERFARLVAVLDRRQPDLTVFLDNVHKPHNLSAVLRNCDAFGVHELHAAWKRQPREARHHTAGGSARWVRVTDHADTGAGLAALRERGFRLLAVHPGESAAPYDALDYTQPTAFVLGAELDGLSARALELADRSVRIPMVGMVQSFNVSVAAALMLAEAWRQRQAAGLYSTPRLPAVEYRRTLFEWAHPQVAAWCRRHGRDYPRIDGQGDIVEEFRR